MDRVRPPFPPLPPPLLYVSAQLNPDRTNILSWRDKNQCAHTHLMKCTPLVLSYPDDNRGLRRAALTQGSEHKRVTPHVFVCVWLQRQLCGSQGSCHPTSPNQPSQWEESRKPTPVRSVALALCKSALTCKFMIIVSNYKMSCPHS